MVCGRSSPQRGCALVSFGPVEVVSSLVGPLTKRRAFEVTIHGGRTVFIQHHDIVDGNVTLEATSSNSFEAQFSGAGRVHVDLGKSPTIALCSLTSPNPRKQIRRIINEMVNGDEDSLVTEKLTRHWSGSRQRLVLKWYTCWFQITIQRGLREQGGKGAGRKGSWEEKELGGKGLGRKGSWEEKELLPNNQPPLQFPISGLTTFWQLPNANDTEMNTARLQCKENYEISYAGMIGQIQIKILKTSGRLQGLWTWLKISYTVNVECSAQIEGNRQKQGKA